MREALRVCIIRRLEDDARADDLWGELAAALRGQPLEIEKTLPPASVEELPGAALTIFLLPSFEAQDLTVFAPLLVGAKGVVLVVEPDGQRHLRPDLEFSLPRAASSPFGALPSHSAPPVDPALAAAFALLPRARGPRDMPVTFFGVSSLPPETVAADDPPAKASPTGDDDSPPSEIHLNAWFEESRVRLVVGRAATLCVNLGPPREAEKGSASEALSAETVKAMEALDHVDVLVTARWADVARPWRKRLSMPPDPANVLTWEVTPRRAGKIDVDVVLAICNEPVHELHLTLDAVDAAADLAEVRAT